MGETEIAVAAGEVPHALAEGIDGGVAGAVDGAAVALGGDEGGHGFERRQEVGDEGLAVERGRGRVGADEGCLGGSGIGEREGDAEGEEYECE